MLVFLLTTLILFGTQRFLGFQNRIENLVFDFLTSFLSVIAHRLLNFILWLIQKLMFKFNFIQLPILYFILYKSLITRKSFLTRYFYFIVLISINHFRFLFYIKTY